MKKYFKKFGIMFVMTLILSLGFCISAFADDEVVVGTANLNNTSENSAVVGKQLTAPEIGWKRYDDTNSNISYIGSGWTEYSASTEYKNGTAYTNMPNGASVKFNFTGTKIRIINPHNPSQNTSEEVYIDGVKVNTHSLSSTNLRQVLVYNYENLSGGEHCFEYKFVGTGITAFDAVDIDKNGILKPYNESITLDKSTMNLIEGDSDKLTATTTPAGAQVTWKSSDSSVATVDSTGKITGVKEGTCTITATATDGLTATCVVTVIPKGTDPNPQPIDTEYITNIAHAKGTNTNNPGGEVTIIFHGSSDTTLSLVKTTDVKDVWIGDNFTYTLVITNTGTKTAKAVVVNDPAPNHIDFNVSGVTTTQGTVDSSSTSKNIIVNVGDILPGGTVTIKIPSTVIA
ncbi:Ig-like domain-containing protein [Clostridium saccharoperbutylacetonicum]|uniref:Ig-like domain-containing protein n=1 Tax=Clostridium saccharoperbutylacetonicum TaxID=36745 RepID=UPI000983DD40|nr:Ig-like domain-containing protein [Clostridium saccharoperbutylacetonicum]AQR95206.1 bacterial Ig-like domain protein [Clostridium saccharoperbutylacetonicum]NSB31060.1 putative repeat protein (TIGR01451 family) [Clostridium saccharoperbutylacetonicum]